MPLDKKTFICVASGPSLTDEDCHLIMRTNYPIIAVNNSWRKVPTCDHIYAGDLTWWRKYHDEVPNTMVKWTSIRTTIKDYPDIQYMPIPAKGPFNSGMRAICLAHNLGAERVLLLGYDCSLANGLHWHGPHADDLSNPKDSDIEKWHGCFNQVPDIIGDMSVINCSRYTELKTFKTNTLEDELWSSSIRL
jgi:hypothetical protein